MLEYLPRHAESLAHARNHEFWNDVDDLKYHGRIRSEKDRQNRYDTHMCANHNDPGDVHNQEYSACMLDKTHNERSANEHTRSIMSLSPNLS